MKDGRDFYEVLWDACECGMDDIIKDKVRYTSTRRAHAALTLNIYDTIDPIVDAVVRESVER